jgi:hypothetical protein
VLLIAVAFCGFVFYVGIPSFVLAFASRSVLRSLDGARSVTVSEFVPYLDLSTDGIGQRERVLRSVVASQEEVASFRRATGGFLDFGFPLAHNRCFTPHHRVDVVRADGSIFRFEVCFLCDNVRFDGPIQTIPRRWLPGLKRFFIDLGMAPRTSEEYAKLTPEGALPLR